MSNENLSFSQQGLILLKRDEGVIEGLYDDDSNYCTSGVGHLVHTKDKWASFLLAAASADPTIQCGR
jgi:GH24 family phage-related lysozyme (muramidase)